MTTAILRTIALAWAALFFLVGQSHASEASDAIEVLCPRDPYPWPPLTWMAPIVETASVRYSVSPVVLVALMHAESNCRMKVNRRTWAIGLFQITENGSANPDHLTRAQLMGVPENINLGARHLSGLLAMCGTLGGAVHVYHGNRTCSGWRHDKYARKVLSLVARAKRVIARIQAARS